jgi:hypothetical protein
VSLTKFVIEQEKLRKDIIDRCLRAIEEQGVYGEDGQEDLALDILELLGINRKDVTG